MKEDKFVAKNLEKWHKLEAYNFILSKKGVNGLDASQIKDFAGLYRNISHHLSYARTYFEGSNIVAYLNQLIGASHNYIFTREEKGLVGFKSYLTKGLPLSLRENRGYIYSAFLIFMAGFFFCLVFILNMPEYGDFFFPGVNASDLNLNPAGDDSWSYTLLSSFIMVNNIRVSFLAFALGVTAGIGTVYVLFYNGMVIGALTAVVIAGNASMSRYFAMLLPHGFIELTAIFISGGAGLLIGKGMLVPGNMKRKDSLIKNAKQAAYLIPCIIMMLIVAGIIEGFFTPLAINHWFKLVFAFLTLGLMFLYYRFYLRQAKNQPENLSFIDKY